MAIQVNGTQVIGNSRELTNITSVDATTVATLNAGGVGGGGFEPTTVSGTTPALNVGSNNFFQQAQLTSNITLSFSNVPTEANWRYKTVGGSVPAPFSSGAVLANSVYDGSNKVAVSSGKSPQSVGMTADGGVVFYGWGQIYTSSSARVLYASLSTPFDLTSAGSWSELNVGQDLQTVDGIDLSPDGTKLLMQGQYNYPGGLDIGERASLFTLSTANNFATASRSGVATTNNAGLDSRSACWTGNGFAFFTSGNDNDTRMYDVSSAYTLNSAAVNQDRISGTSFAGMHWNSTGTVFTGLPWASGTVNEYTLNVGATPNNAGSVGSNSSITSQLTLTTPSTSPGFYLVDSGFLVCDSNYIYFYDAIGNSKVTFPSSVKNASSVIIPDDTTATLEFYTTDGGANIYLIGVEEVE